jgi:AraC-like DNA-binding protein
MATLHRPPIPALRALVSQVWAQEPEPDALPSHGAREHVLPTGATHIALRIGGSPLRLFEPSADKLSLSLGPAVVGGARTAYHLRDVSEPSASVGAMLQPGAALVLLGVPESALAGHHTPLDALWPAAEVAALTERLLACGDLAGRLALFERWLLGRAAGQRSALHPALRGLLHRPARPDLRVADLVRASGLSHRHCIALFRQATGLTPHDWLALQRFGCALDLASRSTESWSDIAAAAGYADQAHLANAFRAMAGVTPTEWRRRADPAAPRHVPQRP